MATKESSPDWREFENYVDILFRSAGYRTEKNVEIGGFEFDLIATRDEFAGFFVRIAVECKNHSKQAVSNTEIHSFLNAYHANRDRLNFSHAIVVTNTRFSRQAHEAVNQHPAIKLLQIANLEDELLGARSYLSQTIRNYHSHVGSKFIDLSATLDGEDQRKTPIPRIAEHILGKISENKRSFSLILGDFGSGKTTVAEQIHRSYAESYLDDGNGVYPFIFYLRTLGQHDSEQSYIASQLTLSSRGVSSELYNWISSKKSSVLILDGFDEVATNSTQDERLMLFSRIMRISQNSSHLIITSRPSYFANIQEINELVTLLIGRDFSISATINKKKTRRDEDRRDLALEKISNISRSRFNSRGYDLFKASESSVYFLKPFNKINIIAYLDHYSVEIHKKHRKTPSEIYEILLNVYDVTDLITRPLLLEMFADVLTSDALDLNDPDLEIGPTGLYQIYINLHLDRDWSVRQFLTRDERLTFARAAAIAMLEKGGDLEATYSSIEEVVSRGMTGIETWRQSELTGQMAKVINDVRVCSFINVTPRDRIEFSHKSFMEYFTADVIISKLRTGLRIPEFDLPLNYEILYFIGGYALLRADYILDFLHHFRHVAYREKDVYQSNLKMCILYSERISKEREFNSIYFGSCKIRKRTFSGCQFSNISFRKVALDDVEFSLCTFRSTHFSGEITNTVFDGCDGSIDLTGQLSNINIYSSNRFEISTDFEKLAFHGGHWVGNNFQISAMDVSLDNIIVDDCTILFEKSGTIYLNNSAISKSKVFFRTEPASKVDNFVKIITRGTTTIKSTCFGGIRLTLENYENIFPVIRNCYGYLIVDDPGQKLRSFIRKSKSDKIERYQGWAIFGSLIVLSAEKRLDSPELQENAKRFTEREWDRFVPEWREQHASL